MDIILSIQSVNLAFKIANLATIHSPAINAKVTSICIMESV